MSLSWEQYTAMEEAANLGICQEHAARFDIHEDTEDYMERYGMSGCDEMPCCKGCPLRKNEKPDGH
jgi:hypothetical protein